MDTGKVIVAGWYCVDPARRGEVIEAVRKMVLRARSTPGCLDFAITADPVEPGRINLFEFWRSGKDLASWRSAARPSKPIAPMLRVEVQEHVVRQSGPPSAGRRSAPQASTRSPRRKTPATGSRAAKGSRPE